MNAFGKMIEAGVVVSDISSVGWSTGAQVLILSHCTPTHETPSWGRDYVFRDAQHRAPPAAQSI